MPYPTLWLNEAACEQMIAEAERAAPDETGGMLLGWENPDRNEIVVSAIVGPGPNATHTPTAFWPDADWQQRQLDAHYGQSEGRITYLGDWHVHPRGGFGMSRRDRRTMARIARDDLARCRQPVMGLAARFEDGYRIGVWRWESWWWPLGYGRAVPLPVRKWTPTPDETSWTS